MDHDEPPALPGPVPRPRRLRTTSAMRRLTAEVRIHARDLVLPLFVKEGLSAPAEVPSMPGVFQHTEESLLTAARDAVEAGVGGLMLFGVPSRRDPQGSEGLNPDGILNRSLALLDRELGQDTVLMADTCLDEFTSHGHCGLLDGAGRVDNDATVEAYARMAVVQAARGAHVVAPSGMMDGQVGAIRAALDEAGHQDVSILAYSAKYASAFYGPFRDAVDSELQGDRRSYQMNASNRKEALREALLDVEQGADMVMVKPAMSYLDIVSDVSAAVEVPVAAYQVSGEYAMVEAAAARGWIDRRGAIEESLTGIRRAGADMVLTYWAAEAAGWLQGPQG